jgi:repressor LexA
MDSNKQERPSKKQYELLEFIEKFIKDQGYGPSYREIMDGCGYSSVATVALHVNNLILKGYLRKKDHSARSLEVTGSVATKNTADNDGLGSTKEKWLISIVEAKFTSAEKDPAVDKQEELETLVNALKILNFAESAHSFRNRLDQLKQKHH